MKKNKTLSADLTALRDQAEALLKTGQKKPVEFLSSPEELQRVIHELAVYQIELEMQQDELLQARLELEESLEGYTDLYDFAPLGYVTLARDGTIRQVNLTGATLLGVERSRLVGDHFGRFVSPEDRPVFHALLERVFSNKDHASCEVMLVREETPSSAADPFGSPHATVVVPSHTVRIDAVLSNDDQEYRIVVSDITMQKKIEQENTELKARLTHRGSSESNGRRVDGAASDFNHELLDKVIHARIRFAVLSYLYTVNQACFVDIKKQVRTTDGNLSVHMRLLELAGYISCEREVQERKPQTIYSITPKGHDAFIQYKTYLRDFLGT